MQCLQNTVYLRQLCQIQELNLFQTGSEHLQQTEHQTCCIIVISSAEQWTSRFMHKIHKMHTQ